MLTPAQVAKLANVHANSIRKWSKDYASFLSPSASGANGPRLYSDADVETLTHIAALRASGVPPAEIPSHLHRPIVDLPPTPSSQATPAGVASNKESLQSPPTTSTALVSPSMISEASIMIVYTNLQNQIDALEAERREQRRQTRRDLRRAWWRGAFTMLLLAALTVASIALYWLLIFPR